MEKFSRKLRRTASVIAVAGAMMIAGLATEAQALNVPSNSLVLALFGNDQEYFQVLGDTTTLATGPETTFDVSTGLAGVGGSNPIQYSLFSVSQATGRTTTSSSVPLSGWTAANFTSLSLANAQGAIGTWFQLAPPALGGTNDVTVLNSDPNSFTSRMGNDGLIGGGFPIAQVGSLDQLLTLLEGDQFNSQNPLTEIGQALLLADGTLKIGSSVTPPAIPLPPAVWLFGTGLASLVGLARRSKANASVKVG